MIKFICLILLFSSFSTFSGQWKGDYEITGFVIEGSDNQPFANINLIPNPETPCADNTFVTLKTDSKMGEQALSAIIMAAASNKKIKLFIDGCTGARPLIKHVWVIN